MQGESMKKLLKGEHQKNWRKAVLFEYYLDAYWPYAGPNQIAVRTDKFKLIDNFLKNDIDELYDLVNDPGEMVNLINSPEHQNVENELRDTAEDLKEKYKYNPDRDWWLRQVIEQNKSNILNN
jgi:N-acetylglucosamine-6-sulfatase